MPAIRIASAVVRRQRVRCRLGVGVAARLGLRLEGIEGGAEKFVRVMLAVPAEDGEPA